MSRVAEAHVGDGLPSGERLAIERTERPVRGARKVSKRMGSNLQRFLGGSPLAVLVKLAFLSLLVGAFMSFLGVTPGELIGRVWWTLQSMFDISLDSLRE